MKKFKKSFIRYIKDNEYQSQCPHCEHDNIKPKKRDTTTDYPVCEVCGNKYYADLGQVREEMFNAH